MASRASYDCPAQTLFADTAGVESLYLIWEGASLPAVKKGSSRSRLVLMFYFPSYSGS